jgi:hypothetical protein
MRFWQNCTRERERRAVTSRWCRSISGSGRRRPPRQCGPRRPPRREGRRRQPASGWAPASSWCRSSAALDGRRGSLASCRRRGGAGCRGRACQRNVTARTRAGRPACGGVHLPPPSTRRSSRRPARADDPGAASGLQIQDYPRRLAPPSRPAPAMITRTSPTPTRTARWLHAMFTDRHPPFCW